MRTNNCESGIMISVLYIDWNNTKVGFKSDRPASSIIALTRFNVEFCMYVRRVIILESSSSCTD